MPMPQRRSASLVSVSTIASVASAPQGRRSASVVSLAPRSTVSAPSAVEWRRPRNMLTLDYFSAADGGHTTTYVRDISHHDGPRGSEGRRARKPQGIGGQQTPPPKGARRSTNTSVLRDPHILGLARAVREAEGHEVNPKTDTEFVTSIRQKQRIDHVSAMFATTKGTDSDLTTYQRRHRAYENEATPDKTNFFKRNFNSDYNEAIAKQKGIMAEKR